MQRLIGYAAILTAGLVGNVDAHAVAMSYRSVTVPGWSLRWLF